MWSEVPRHRTVCKNHCGWNISSLSLGQLCRTVVLIDYKSLWHLLQARRNQFQREHSLLLRSWFFKKHLCNLWKSHDHVRAGTLFPIKSWPHLCDQRSGWENFLLIIYTNQSLSPGMCWKRDSLYWEGTIALPRSPRRVNSATMSCVDRAVTFMCTHFSHWK